MTWLKCEIINTTRVGKFMNLTVLTVPVNKPCIIMVNPIYSLWNCYKTTRSKLKKRIQWNMISAVDLCPIGSIRNECLVRHQTHVAFHYYTTNLTHRGLRKMYAVSHRKLSNVLSCKRNMYNFTYICLYAFRVQWAISVPDNRVLPSGSKLLYDQLLTKICGYMTSITMSEGIPYTPTCIRLAHE